MIAMIVSFYMNMNDDDDDNTKHVILYIIIVCLPIKETIILIW